MENGTEKPKEQIEMESCALGAMISSLLALIGGCFSLPGIILRPLVLAGVLLGFLSLFRAIKYKFSVKKPIFGIIVSLFSLLIIVATGSSKTSSSSKKVESSTDTSSSTENKTDSENSKDNSKTEEKDVYKVGDTIEIDGKRITVKNVKRNYSTGNRFSTPKAGNEFIKVYIKIANSSKNETSINSWDFKIQDSKGLIKSDSPATYSSDDHLEYSKLAPGGIVEGTVIFEVPKNDSGLKLIYDCSSLFSNKKITIKL